jgi:uncharacterized protein HemX
MPPTGEQPSVAQPVIVSKKTLLGMDLETVVLIICFAFALGGTWMSVRASLAEAQDRQQTEATARSIVEQRVAKLEDAKASTDLHLQRLDDNVQTDTEILKQMQQTLNDFVQRQRDQRR